MNIQKMMKQAQEMQQKMTEMQEELAQREFEGSAGGGMVKITVNGRGGMQNVSLDDSLLSVDEKDMLEDLIVAAFADAKKKADETAESELGSLTGGMGLPADFKMPF